MVSTQSDESHHDNFLYCTAWFVDEVKLEEHLPLSDLLTLTLKSEVKGQAVGMENQPWYDGIGQSYGWTLYSKSVKSGGEVQTYGQIRDRTSVYLNGSHVTTFDCNTIDYKFKIVS